MSAATAIARRRHAPRGPHRAAHSVFGSLLRAQSFRTLWVRTSAGRELGLFLFGPGQVIGGVTMHKARGIRNAEYWVTHSDEGWCMQSDTSSAKPVSFVILEEEIWLKRMHVWASHDLAGKSSEESEASHGA